ncbi:MAG: energy-coupling factor transporter transmembrane protein EcfT [Lachnospiraceae bacterium]|nr:energy-coupling factor transporter transmembrane protein EcfT [Lachnospiraceae bacterium]
MLREITLGQYYPTDSVIHKLDPRVKLAGTLVFIISLFAFGSIEAYVVATIFLAAVIKTSKVPFRFMIKGLKAIIMLLMITVVFNLFLVQGTVVVKFWVFQITQEGIKTAVSMAIRLIYLIIGSSVMTLTTTPNDLTDGLEKALSPLKKLHAPIHEISMMMSIALRFIPILLEETDKIMKAQQARGADFESGNLLQKAKNMIPLLVPLFISAFRRANDLAMAMEARGYHGGEGRTKMRPLVYKSRDKAGYLILLGYFVIMFAVSRFSVLETLLFGVLGW